MELLNQTPYAGRVLVAPDTAGAEAAVVVLKATFEVAPGEVPVVAPEQTEIALVDVYADEPGASSIVRPSDLCLGKPGTDLLLVGHARPERDDTQVDVEFQVGRHRKQLRVFGERRWERVLGLTRMSPPKPFDAIPLVWENAFGGADATPRREKHHAFEARNPIGRGFRAKGSRRDVEADPLPNIEDPAALIRRPGHRPAPAGCGPIAPGWQPRAAYAGSYDEAWLRDTAPLLPADFDPRFFDRAPAGLVASDPPRAGERVVVRGMGRAVALDFTLPDVAPRARLVLRDALEDLPLHLDTLLVDTERSRLELTFSGHRRIQGRLRHVVGIEVSVPKAASA